MNVDIKYCVTFGDGDGSDWLDYDVELTPEEEQAYEEAIESELDYEDFGEIEILQNVLDRATEEICASELASALELEDSVAMECQGLYPVDPDEINELVKKHDPHALTYFHLESLSQEELQQWDASDLDDLPLVCDFDPDFTPVNPFYAYYEVDVQFSDPDDSEW